MRIEHLPAERFSRMRWRNGRGWTLQIHSQPVNDEQFDWRASIAEIDAEAPYSPFPGCLRDQVLLQGEGLSLDFDGQNFQRLMPPHERIRFSGDATPLGRPIDGPVRVFNLIHRPQRVQVELLHRPLAGAMLFFPDPEMEWLIFLLSGKAEIGRGDSRISLSQGDALRLSRDQNQERRILHGAGEVLVARIARVATPC